ncbi:hypothetical protein [Cloacibacillus porcorum]
MKQTKAGQDLFNPVPSFRRQKFKMKGKNCMIFDEKKPKESNEITNKELKESIANAALGILHKDIDFDDLVYTKVVFGYLFNIEGHGIEALFKIITDKTTAYFAVQGTEIIRLNFSEELFQTTVDGFLDLHS